jgi:hypothetical protein
MNNLFQTVIPAAVAFLVRFQGALTAPAGSAAASYQGASCGLSVGGVNAPRTSLDTSRDS